jgi:hypothetical protein
MEPVSLEKRIERGTWRSIGMRMTGFSPGDIPIGGISIRALLGHAGGTPFRIGAIRPHNAFVIERPPFRLLYVRAAYSGYRRAAKTVFPETDWKVDYDHALGRKMAQQLGFHYVLLLRIVPSVNRGHGPWERAAPLTGPNLHKLCFASPRILDKWLGRPPKLMNDPARLQPYRLGLRHDLGLTLKQAGKWGFAMGVEDDPRPMPDALEPLHRVASALGYAGGGDFSRAFGKRPGRRRRGGARI